MKDIKEMEKIHEEIKNHIWRVNGKGIKSFCTITRKFIYMFLDCLKEDYKETGTKIPDMFFHETLSALFALKDLEEYMTVEKKADSITAVESSIGVIHRYINSGKFESFMTYYSGSNYDKKKGRWTQWTFHKKLNRFDLAPKYKDIVIKQYESKLEKCKDKELIDTYNEELKYWKSIDTK